MKYSGKLYAWLNMPTAARLGERVAALSGVTPIVLYEIKDIGNDCYVLSRDSKGKLIEYRLEIYVSSMTFEDIDFGLPIAVEISVFETKNRKRIDGIPLEHARMTFWCSMDTRFGVLRYISHNDKSGFKEREYAWPSDEVDGEIQLHERMNFMSSLSALRTAVPLSLLSS